VNTGINAKRILIPGLAAGVVLNVIDFASNMFLLGGRTQNDLLAVNPILWDALNRPSLIAVFVAIDFVLGFLLIWLYAAIRPRFGPGPATAVRAALFAWLLSTLMWSFFYLMGVYSGGTFVLSGLVALVNMLAAAWVAGKLYSEPA
jgi:hypothetical protein